MASVGIDSIGFCHAQFCDLKRSLLRYVVDLIEAFTVSG